MPIKFDKEPNSVRKYQRRRDGTFMKDYVPEPTPEILPAPTMRVRILRNIIHSRSGTFMAGQVVHLPIGKAQSWIELGLAEEDKSIDAAPETK